MAGVPKRPATVKPSELHNRGVSTPKRVVIPELKKYNPEKFTAKAIKENVKRFTKEDISTIIKKSKSLSTNLRKRYLLSLGIDSRLLLNNLTLSELRSQFTFRELQELFTVQELIKNYGSRKYQENFNEREMEIL